MPNRVTHTFIGDDDCLDSDTVVGVKKTLVAPFTPCTDGKTDWQSEFDFVLIPETAD